MKSYSIKEGNWYRENYYDTCVLDSGQSIRIEFQEDWSKTKYYYNIYLVISDKRKSIDNTYLKSTGKDGIKGLLWAKQKIKEFEDMIKAKHEGVPIVIYAWWDDNRRRNVYERGLRDLGYRFTNLFGNKVLAKRV